MAIILTLAISLATPFSYPATAGTDLAIQALFFVTVVVSAILFAVSICRAGLTAETILWFFCLVFFGICPFTFYRTGEWSFGAISTTREVELVYTLAINLLFMATCYAGLRAGTRKAHRLFPVWHHRLESRELSPDRIPLLVGLQAVTCIGLYALFGKDMMLVRGAVTEAAVDQSVILLVTGAARPFVLFVFLAVLLRGSAEKWQRLKLWAVISGVIALAGNFPLSFPRFYLLFMATVVTYIMAFRRKGWVYVSYGFLLVGFFGGMVADKFRQFESVSDLDKVMQIETSGDYIFQGHFDAFEMTCYGVQFVSDTGIVWGREFLGVLFFWVPRAIWASKPVGTGGLLGGGYIGITGTTANINLSAPLPLEGYINFGIIGVLATGFLFGWFSGLCDGFVSHARGPQGPRDRQMPVYLLMASFIGMATFIMRGSLISGVAYTAGIVFAFVALMTLGSRRVGPGQRVQQIR